MMRDADELMKSGLAVIERAYVMGAHKIRGLFSGGHDSICATFVASQHRGFTGDVDLINTGIGSQYAREFVQRTCDKFGWRLHVHRSNISYESIVANHGFPGPAAHGMMYRSLKDRCVYKIARGSRAWKRMCMLVNGARAQESVRRMGVVKPIQVGDVMKNGTVRNQNRVWVAPCHDWSKAEQMHFMDEFGLPINKIKVAIGLSGECFCGAMASPGERELIREHAPDVEQELVRLTAIAKANGKPCIWGQRPPGKIEIAETGPMCHGCDLRLAMSGIKTTPMT